MWHTTQSVDCQFLHLIRNLHYICFKTVNVNAMKCLRNQKFCPRHVSKIWGKSRKKTQTIISGLKILSYSVGSLQYRLCTSKTVQSVEACSLEVSPSWGPPCSHLCPGLSWQDWLVRLWQTCLGMSWQISSLTSLGTLPLYFTICWVSHFFSLTVLHTEGTMYVLTLVTGHEAQ